MMPPQHIMSKLYYRIGLQATDYSLQHSHRENDEVIWSKRRSFLGLDPFQDRWFIEHANHRQILKNEIIFDFDRCISANLALNDYDVKKLIDELKQDDWRFCVFHSGSKGVHVHIFFDGLISLTKEKRETFRMGVLKHYSWFAGVDYQKASDSTMIALEFVPHWKTGNEKTLLYNYGVEAWN